MVMRRKILTWIVATFLAGVYAGVGFGAQPQSEPGAGEEKAVETYRVGGKRDGPSFFPRVHYPEVKPLKEGELDFEHYPTYGEIHGFLQRWAREYPQILELYSVGRTFEGREIWQVTVTNRETGKDTDKPAMFAEGGRHSGEIASSVSIVQLIHLLVTGYGKDPEITHLVDTKAFYLRPVNNPDGAELFLLTAQTNRSSVRPHDTDQDGLVDEDPGEDLDGDGLLLQMRRHVGEGKGNAIRDPRDPDRLMKMVPEGRGTGRSTRRAWTTTGTANSTRTGSADWTCTATIRRTGGRNRAGTPPAGGSPRWAQANTPCPRRRRGPWSSSS